MKLAGIDYSYTNPVVIVYDTAEELKFKNMDVFNLNTIQKREGQHQNIRIDVLRDKDWVTQEERFHKISVWSTGILKDLGVERVAIEGYAMGSTVGRVFDIAENTALLKQFMYHQGIPFEKFPPTQVKKVFTGKGNAKKEQMVDEFHRRNPEVSLHDIVGVDPYKKPIDDVADAYAILLMDEYFKC